MSRTVRNHSQESFTLFKRLKASEFLACPCVYVLVWVVSQAPSDRQQRYKEKVTELRRKRNSGLNKEQKEKCVVSI